MDCFRGMTGGREVLVVVDAYAQGSLWLESRLVTIRHQRSYSWPAAREEQVACRQALLTEEGDAEQLTLTSILTVVPSSVCLPVRCSVEGGCCKPMPVETQHPYGIQNATESVA